MDWLRIGAFAILILYHIGMVFVPWPFHAKSRHVEDWALIPMFGANAWRLTLLFVVSGYATRALLGRAHSLREFMRNRSERLLIPLLFGVALVVPPQPWVELVTRHGYTGGFLSFWTGDYWRFGTLAGIPLPNWHHLWFVGYLWVYTAALALMVVLVRPLRWQHAFNHAFCGWGILVWPLVWLGCIHAWWYPFAAETHGLVDDPMAHLEYLPAFLFGFGLARSECAMAAIVRIHRWAAALALGGYLWIVAVHLKVAPMGGGWVRWYGLMHALEQWGAVIALIGFAERHWNRDLPIRPTLTEAVFPFYLVHQTIIVAVAYWLLGAGLDGWAEFLVLVAATVGGCWAFYLVGRRIGPLRPLIGLRRRPRRDPSRAIGT